MTRRRSLPLVALLTALALGGCVSVLPKSKPVQLYRFGAGAPAGEAAPASPPQGVTAPPAVALGSVVLPRAAASDGLLTTTGDQAAYVAGARWVSPAVVLMREAAVRAFAGRSDVRLTGPDGPASARLDLLVTDFEADYPAPGAAPVVRLALTATLTPRTGPVQTRTFAVSRTAAENRLAAIVPAYDAAVRDGLGQVAGWVQASTLR